MYMFCRIAGQLLVRILFRVKVSGLHNIPRTGPFLVSSNHISYLDPAVIGAFIPRQLHYLARESLFRVPLFGTLIRWCNSFPVRREQVSPATIRRALAVLRDGYGLLVFPEGTRSLDGKLQEGKVGAGMIAVNARVPVIPTLLVGTDRALPVHARWIRLKKVAVHYGEPVQVEGVRSGESRREAYQRTSDLIMDHIREMANRYSPQMLRQE